MGSEWPMAPLFDVAAVDFGWPFKSELFNSVRRGLPLVRIRDLNAPEECLFTGETGYPDSVVLDTGDLLVGMDGAFGVYRWARGKALLNQRVCRVRPLSENQLDREFLRAALVAPIADVERGKTGTTVIHLNKSDLERVRVAWPRERVRRRIGAVLGVLDDKIELNQRMCRTLDEMAQGVFDALCASRCEGDHPAGWTEEVVGDAVRVEGGTTPSTIREDFWSCGRHAFCTPKDMSGLSTPVLLDTERHLTDAGLAAIGSGLMPPGTVLMSSRAPIGYLAVAERPVAVNQGVIAMVCERAISPMFMLRWAKGNLPLIVSVANGSTFLEVSKGNFKKLPIIVPDSATLTEFEQLVEPLHRRMVACEETSQIVKQVRDSLLPRLLSGEVAVTTAAHHPGE